MINFSIITVVLNDLVGLKRTERSISGQQGAEFEWLVCDGNSGENTINFLKHSSTCVHWISSPDLGIYDAMNQGVSMASGNYIVFMNAGDTFHENDVLAKVASKLSAESSVVDILFGGAQMSFAVSKRMIYRPPKRMEKYLWHGLPANHQATYYRRELLNNNPYDLQYQICGDYYLVASLMCKGALAVYLDEPLATFEVGGVSYKRRIKLFTEPYRIQRDVLGIPFYYRLLSIIKRSVSTAGFVLLSQSVFLKKNKNNT